jgi:hypothetical protein
VENAEKKENKDKVVQEDTAATQEEDTSAREGEQVAQEEVIPEPAPVQTPSEDTPSGAPEPPAPTPSVEVGTTEEIVVEEVEEVEVPEIKVEVEVETAHKSVASSDYYQYAGLSSSEKAIYDVISSAIANADSYVDISKKNCSKDTLSKVYYAVISDNPQYFYLTNRYAYTFGRSVEKLILLYMDGSNADDIDTRTGNLKLNADRTEIANQISEFNGKVEEILKKIPISATEVEKEKRIYDYIQDTVTYDHEAAKLVNSTDAIADHAFDAYGAACAGQAVCEGYAEFFQYLCYGVGINATQVYGSSNGGPHMWNTAYIHSEWYMLDVTWDDQGTNGIHYYMYFDLTTSEMTSYNHTIDTSNIRVPECTSTKHACYREFAMYVESLNATPVNYQSVLDYVATNKEAFLCVYAGNQSKNAQKFLATYLFSAQSDVQKYMKSKGYKFSFEPQYYISGNYCYIRMKWE